MPDQLTDAEFIRHHAPNMGKARWTRQAIADEANRIADRIEQTERERDHWMESYENVRGDCADAERQRDECVALLERIRVEARCTDEIGDRIGLRDSILMSLDALLDRIKGGDDGRD